MASGLAYWGRVMVPRMDTVAELLAVTGSNSFAVTQVNVRLVPPPMRTTRVTAARAPAVRFPRLQVTTPLALAQVPWLVSAETKPERPDSRLTRVTPVAAERPRLVTLTVMVALVPTPTRLAVLEAVRSTSAAGWTFSA